MADPLPTSRMLSRCRLLLLLLLSLLVASCQRGVKFKTVYPVKGRVLVNGKPAEGVTVMFNLLNDPSLTDPSELYVKPKGKTDAEGWFTLTTYKGNDGIPAGNYAVTLFWVPKGFAGDFDKANKLPARYKDPETSEIKVTIAAKNNVLEPFDLHD